MMRATMFTIVIFSCIVLIPNCLAQESQNKTYEFGPLKLDPNVKISDFFTFGTVLISVVTIFLTVRGDKNLRQREQAEKVRNAETKMIENMLRWRELSLSIFDDLDIVYAEEEKNTKGNWDRQGLYESLCNKFIEPYCKLCKKRLDENIEVIHSEKFDYDPFVCLFFKDVLNRLKMEEDIMKQAGIIGGIWSIIFYDENDASKSSVSSYHLKDHIERVRGIYELRINSFQDSIRDYLLYFMSKSEGEILKDKNTYFNIKSVNLPPNPNSEMYAISRKKAPKIVHSKNEE